MASAQRRKHWHEQDTVVVAEVVCAPEQSGEGFESGNDDDDAEKDAPESAPTEQPPPAAKPDKSPITKDTLYPGRRVAVYWDTATRFFEGEVKKVTWHPACNAASMRVHYDDEDKATYSVFGILAPQWFFVEDEGYKGKEGLKPCNSDVRVEQEYVWHVKAQREADKRRLKADWEAVKKRRNEFHEKEESEFREKLGTDTWHCPMCTFLNTWRHKLCRACYKGHRNQVLTLRRVGKEHMGALKHVPAGMVSHK